MAGDLWTQRGGDAGHTSYVDTSFDPAALNRIWSQAVGNGVGSIQRAVAIDETHVYRTVHESGSFNGTFRLVAFDLETGTEVWHQIIKANAYAGVGEPSVANGIVYVNQAGHSDSSGGTDADLPWLYGFDVATGRAVLERTYAAQWASNERPVIADGQLFVADGYYGGISSYDASSLTRQWHVSDERGLYDPPFAAIDDEYAYAFENSVYRRTDGTRLPDITHPTLAWVSDPTVSDTGRLLFMARDHQYYAQNHYVSAFDGDTHAHLWTASMPTVPQGKAVGNGLVAVTAGRDLIILNEADGTQVQSWRSPDPLTSEIILTQTHAFVQSTAGSMARVYAVDLSTGHQVWRFEQPVPSNIPVLEMALSDDHLLLSGRSLMLAFAITGPNAVDDIATTGEDTAVTIDVLANDIGTLTVTDVGPASSGSVAINSNGTVTYRPKANFHGSDTFSYTVSDGNGVTYTASVDVTVKPVNDDPTIADAEFSIKRHPANGSKVGYARARDVDRDILSYSLSGPDAAAFSVTQSGLIRVADASLINFEAQAQFNFTVDVIDGNGGQASAEVEVNPLPPAAKVESFVINDGHRQRSMVNSLRITFDKLVTISQGAFVLSRRGVVIDSSVSTQTINGKTVATLTFGGRAAVGGSLADGEYTLTVVARRIRDSFGYQLDGNGDGREGGNGRHKFFRMFGDADGDRDVDRRDRSRFFSAFGTTSTDSRYLWYFDFDSDRRINQRDNLQFFRRFD